MTDEEIKAAIDAACTRVRRALVSLSEGALEEYDSDGIPVVIPKTRELLAAAKEEMREACVQALYRATPLASGCMDVVREVPVTADKFLARQIAERKGLIEKLEYERGELLHRVADLTKRVETAHLEALSRERIIDILERTLDGPTGHRAKLAKALADNEALAIRVSVLDGSACAEERAEGNGGCGMCAWCCKSALERAETAEIALQALRERKP